MLFNYSVPSSEGTSLPDSVSVAASFCSPSFDSDSLSFSTNSGAVASLTSFPTGDSCCDDFE